MELFIILLAVAGFLEIILLVLLSFLGRENEYVEREVRNERKVRSDLNKIKKQIEA